MTFCRTSLLHVINIWAILRAEHRENLEINVEQTRLDSGFVLSPIQTNMIGYNWILVVPFLIALE